MKDTTVPLFVECHLAIQSGRCTQYGIKDVTLTQAMLSELSEEQQAELADAITRMDTQKIHTTERLVLGGPAGFITVGAMTLPDPPIVDWSLESLCTVLEHRVRLRKKIKDVEKPSETARLEA